MGSRRASRICCPHLVEQFRAFGELRLSKKTRTLTDQYKRQLAWRDWQAALAGCPIEPGQKVLDLGCGPGDISGLLQKRGALVTGIDGEANLLKAAKEKCPEVEFLEQ